MPEIETAALAVGDRPINLTQALKLANLAESGGQAKQLIAEGLVRVNGEVELRKRRQLAVGDLIEVDGEHAASPGALRIKLVHAGQQPG